jgi:hypothetical protein
VYSPLNPVSKRPITYRICTPVVLLDYSHPPPDLPERVSITATLTSPGSPEAVRLVPGPLRANPRGYPSASPMGPAQAPLPCSTGGPIANSALLAVFPHERRCCHTQETVRARLRHRHVAARAPEEPVRRLRHGLLQARAPEARRAGASTAARATASTGAASAGAGNTRANRQQPIALLLDRMDVPK